MNAVELAKMQARIDEALQSAHDADTGDEEPAGVVLPRVDLGELEHVLPTAPEWYWAGYVPAGHVTLFGGHGGMGKSTVALMLAVAMCTGRELFGQPTKACRVLFYSAEDGADMLRSRLARIVRAMALTGEELRDRLHVVDATLIDPVLFADRRIAGVQVGDVTPAYEALQTYVDENDIDAVFIDNLSDVYGADENQRAAVRAFMRALKQLAPNRAITVVLLAHVDKTTARGLASGADSYSGSTAWHNSARSRLLLKATSDGALELVHEKCNVARRQDPIRIEWPTDGLPGVDSPPSGFSAGLQDKLDQRALLSLIHDRESLGTGSGKWVATSQNSANNAVKLFHGERTFPSRRKPSEIFRLLSSAEHQGLIARVEYRTGDRKVRERWALTPSGLALIGAPGAPGAPGGAVGAPVSPSAPPARQVRRVAPGGMGGSARAQDGADAHDEEAFR